MADSPYINRFLQPDTLIPDPANPQAFNRYSYVGNNPIMRNDPTGHDWEDCGDRGGYRCQIHKKKVGEAKLRFAREDFEKTIKGILGGGGGKPQYSPSQQNAAGCPPSEKTENCFPIFEGDFSVEQLDNVIKELDNLQSNLYWAGGIIGTGGGIASAAGGWLLNPILFVGGVGGMAVGGDLLFEGTMLGYLRNELVDMRSVALDSPTQTVHTYVFSYADSWGSPSMTYLQADGTLHDDAYVANSAITISALFQMRTLQR